MLPPPPVLITPFAYVSEHCQDDIAAQRSEVRWSYLFAHLMWRGFRPVSDDDAWVVPPGQDLPPDLASKLEQDFVWLHTPQSIGNRWRHRERAVRLAALGDPDALPARMMIWERAGQRWSFRPEVVDAARRKMSGILVLDVWLTSPESERPGTRYSDRLSGVATTAVEQGKLRLTTPDYDLSGTPYATHYDLVETMESEDWRPEVAASGSDQLSLAHSCKHGSI